MRTSDFDYHLPPELIAQTPVEPRDHSRLLVLSQETGAMEHRRFYEIGDYLRAGDVLVGNQSRVIPARLLGRKATGGKAEVFLLRNLGPDLWQALLRSGRGMGVGAKVQVGDVVAEVIGRNDDGTWRVRFPEGALEAYGNVPLPPYIHTPLADPERYQTVYARIPGSVAAPTAGLHFTPRLMAELEARGVGFLFVTLHIGLDTFRPVKEEDPQEHKIHREYGEVSAEVATEVPKARAQGRRVIAVGTGTARLLEQAAQSGEVRPFAGWADLFILPGYCFRAVDALITNFHHPSSTLLLMVSAFAGRQRILLAYEEAIRRGYRFYSLGDCMLVL